MAVGSLPPRSLESTLPGILASAARRHPRGQAIYAPGRRPLTYAGFEAHVTRVVKQLNESGLGRGSRIAVALEPGPELAVAIVALASGTTCAPLNPAHRRWEYEFYLRDLRIDALVVDGQHGGEAREAAHSAGIQVIDLIPQLEEEAGMFSLELRGDREAVKGREGFVDDADVALVLHTSGTTARPKIVPLSQANICAAARSIRDVLALSDTDCCLNVMPLFHIHGLSAVFASIGAQASVVCPPGFLAPRFLEWVEEFQPTWYTASPAIHHSIQRRAAESPEAVQRGRFRFLRSASAPMPTSLIAAMEETFGVPFLEAYGMTEAAPQIASNRLPPAARHLGSVGLAAGCEVAVMDAASATLLPTGVEGEVVVRGENVMHAYEDNPEANRKSFAAGWFRTGDQGYLDEECNLYITGRLKEIINRGGEKISPREVEEVLLAHAGVTEAVTFAMPDPALGEIVAAAVVLADGADVEEGELRRFVARHLADFKIPARVLIVDEIPRTSGGKTKRSELAETFAARASAPPRREAEPGARAPATESEELVARIFQDVLGLSDITVDEDFLQLGGDSLLAAQILARLDVAGVELDFITFFDDPCIAAVAAHAEGRPRGSTDGIRRSTRKSEEAAPLSFSQQRLWFLHQQNPTSPAYNGVRAFRISGELDVEALRRSLESVVARHESLRTTFTLEQDGPRQVVLGDWHLDLPILEETADGGWYHQLRECAREPFDLTADLMLRPALFRVAPDEHILLIGMHHIAYDAASLAILFRELSHLYAAFRRGDEAHLPTPPVQFRDFAVWQRDRLRGERLEQLLTYWRHTLQDAPSQIDLPVDRARPPLQRLEGARHYVHYSSQLAESVARISRSEAVTPFMTLLAAFDMLLFHASGLDDILVSTPIANRNRVELENVIGFFSNTLVVRNRLRGNPSFRELIRRTRAAALGAYTHQDLPFEKLIESLRIPRDLSRSPLVQVNFRAQRGAPAALDLAGTTVTPIEIDLGFSRFDLALELRLTSDGLGGYFEYDTDLFDAATIENRAGDLERILDRATHEPDEPLLTLVSAIRTPDRSRPRVRSGPTRRTPSFARDEADRGA